MTVLYTPPALALLCLVPLLVFLRYRPGRRPAIRYPEVEVLRRIRPAFAVRAWRLLPLLHACALVCVVVALARPRHGLAERVVRSQGVDIALLIDVSSSMRAEDFSDPRGRRSRLESAQEVMRQFISRRTNDRIALIAFALMPYAVSPLTTDHAWLKRQTDRLSTEMLEDGTAIGSALASAVNRLRRSEAETRLVILLTDGKNNAGAISPETAAQAARAMGVKVYTVGAGSEGYVNIPYRSRYGGIQYRRQWSEIDEEMLRYVAETTGGSYFRARDMKTLGEVYGEIDRMEKTEVEITEYTAYEEAFAGFVVAALLLLGMEKALGLTRLARVPL